MSVFDQTHSLSSAVRRIEVEQTLDALRSLGAMPGFSNATANVIAIALHQEFAPAQALAVRESRVRTIEQFLQARSLSENTQRNYIRQLETFCDWVGKD
jgi:hypothetical protein